MGAIPTNTNCECGWWEDFPVLAILRNERDDILGMMVNCGPMKGSSYDIWVGWDYTLLSSEGKPTRLGMGDVGKVRDLIEGLMKV